MQHDEPRQHQYRVADQAVTSFMALSLGRLLAVVLVKDCQLIEIQPQQLHAGEYVRQILFDELAALERQRLERRTLGQGNSRRRAE